MRIDFNSTAFWGDWKSGLDKTVGGTFQVTKDGGLIKALTPIAAYS